jgi:hypothetical protein
VVAALLAALVLVSGNRDQDAAVDGQCAAIVVDEGC